MQHMNPYSFSSFQVKNNNCSEQFFTLESTPVTDYAVYNTTTFSPQCSNLHHSSDITYEVDDEEEENSMHTLWALKNELLGPDFDFDYSNTPLSRYNKILKIAQYMDLKQLLLTCAETVSEFDTISLSERRVAVSAAEALMDILEKRVSISGEPLQRLGAYMLEGLRARLLSSGSIIYKKLKCKEPTSSELMSYMHVLYQICPYYKFAYTSANVVIGEVMQNESRIHIVDFQVAQGSQWVPFIQAISRRPGGPPSIRITGVDDSESAYARGGGLEVIGQRLAQVAESCGVPFEFNCAAMSGSEVQLVNFKVQHGEALAVNFPYILHHMPDESVTTTNHRDRLIRLVKSLSPKIVTLVEQESNTNTGTFFRRFGEALDYYTAMFESIDAGRRSRGDKMRINAEEHCVAKDVVNIIACEGNDRVERHEVFGKWRLRFSMAGFSQVPVNSTASEAVRDMLKEHSSEYRVREGDGALYLGWKNRALATCSAWM